MFKALSLALGLAVASAHAATLVVPVNTVTALPSCGGTVHTQKTSAGQVNLSFRHVRHCSNFDILAKDFGVIHVEYKNRKIPTDASGTRSGSFTIPPAHLTRGLNGLVVEVRSNGGAHKDVLELVLLDTPVVPVSPTSLRGFCADLDYSNFRAAKAFAYSPNGLNYSDSQATQFALEYNRAHRCGTIAEYQLRFTELYQYGYNPSYLNLSSTAARDFALANVETTTVGAVRAWKVEFPLIYELFYGPAYLNLSSSVSAQKADTWVRRGYCGNATRIAFLKTEFARHYAFAYSPTGLNYSASRSADYAAEKVGALTACGDLLHR